MLDRESQQPRFGNAKAGRSAEEGKKKKTSTDEEWITT